MLNCLQVKYRITMQSNASKLLIVHSPEFTLLEENKLSIVIAYPDSAVHGVNMGPIWGREDPGGSHVGPINFAIWVLIVFPDSNPMKTRGEDY